MFDLGFSELIVVGVVALVVIGPERLPRVARTAGHLLGRLQRYVSDVKTDIQREMQIEDLKKLQEQVQQQARDLEHSMRSQMSKVEADLGQTAAEVTAALPGGTAATAPQSSPEGLTAATTADDSMQAGAQGAGVVAQAVDVPAAPSPQLELGLDAGKRPVEKA